MILIVILVVMASGLAPFRFDGQPDSPDACAVPGALLLVERQGAVIAIDPVILEGRPAPVEPGAARVAERAVRALRNAVPTPWRVVRSSDAAAQRIEVYDSRTGAQVFDVAFRHRIELSTAAVSPSGRFTVHLQANNVASEVTVLDAARGVRWRRDIPHDARLAAFAIGVAFSPNGACAAISMERSGGHGPETWLLDLESGGLSDPPLTDAFALGWVRRQV